MIWAVPLLVVVGIVAGPVLVNLREVWLRRLLGWLVMLATVAAADFALAGCDPILRMVGICCALLGGMKGLVYAEWAGTQKLPLAKYGVFALLWFGMDPGSFRTRRKGLSWKPDLWLGLSLMLAGTLAAWLVWAMGWRHILVMFVPMSVGFHFGALRVLKGGLRSAGFPVRTLFPNVLNARGIGDFWSRRWNVGYSQMMQRLVGRPVENLAGQEAGLMAIFLASGVLHELAITLPVRAGFGLPTLYFAMHGVLTLLERKLGRPLGKIPALLLVVLPLGLLFPPAFQSEVIARCLGVFDMLNTALEN
ncbi:MAG: membrane bound O-acyl transferase family-domain-containing protein [Luteolibacter sp.]